jgi:hypothetical protein
MLQKVRFLQISFDQPIQAYEVAYFRAAIIEKTKRESDLFHNHLEDEKFIYRYPLIQYKIKDKKPTLVCLKEATDDIHYLLKQKDFKFRIGKETINFEIEDVRLKYEYMQTWDSDFTYNIHNWLALNQVHYKQYKKLDGLVEKYRFLEEILEKHLRLFMNEMNANETIPLTVKILDMKGEKFIEYKGVFHLCFSINMKTNLTIPDYIGLGKGVSIGFGIVKKIMDRAKGNEGKDN